MSIVKERYVIFESNEQFSIFKRKITELILAEWVQTEKESLKKLYNAILNIAGALTNDKNFDFENYFAVWNDAIDNGFEIICRGESDFDEFVKPMFVKLMLILKEKYGGTVFDEMYPSIVTKTVESNEIKTKLFSSLKSRDGSHFEKDVRKLMNHIIERGGARPGHIYITPNDPNKVTQIDAAINIGYATKIKKGLFYKYANLIIFFNNTEKSVTDIPDDLLFSWIELLNDFAFIFEEIRIALVVE